jgi:UDP-galactopyranose mutase
MLDHPHIQVQLATDYEQIKERVAFDRVIFTGPIDEFFGYRFGRLPYRSLRFEHRAIARSQYQPVAVVNYPQSEEYTRITEYKHLTGQSHPRTAITIEYPSEHGDPYYPIPRPENQALFKRYEQLGLRSQNVWFVGRLATYRYYNMDQVVGQALATFRRIDDSIPRRRAVDRAVSTEEPVEA